MGASAETLEEFIERKHDPKWKPKPTPCPSKKLRTWPRDEVSRDAIAYQYTCGKDLRTIADSGRLTLETWLHRMAGRNPYRAKKLPSLGAPPKLTAKQRAQETHAVEVWLKLTPEAREVELQRAKPIGVR